MQEKIILLNADYTFLNFVSWQRAVSLLTMGKAMPIKESDRVIRSEKVEIQVPLIMKLVRFINNVYRGKVSYSKKRVWLRDNYVCAYCGNTINPGAATVDHIMPKSQGGKSSFRNCVTACFPCNNRKGGRSLSESGMKLRFRPYEPSIFELLQSQCSNVTRDILSEILSKLTN